VCLAALQTLFKTLAISFSTMTLFTGITPLYGSSLQYAGPAPLVWGWVVVSFFTCFVGVAMAEICSSFPVRPRRTTLDSPRFFYPFYFGSWLVGLVVRSARASHFNGHHLRACVFLFTVAMLSKATCL
jgi:hypothetical protein